MKISGEVVDFDKFVVMQEDFIEKLNMAIEKVTKEKEDLPIDYDLLENVLEVILKTKVEIKKASIDIIEPIKKERALNIVLDFFRQIDEEFYKKAVEVILQQNKRISMKIYDVRTLKKLREKGKLELDEYTLDGSVCFTKGNATVNIPTNTKLNSKEEKTIGKNSCTLEDLYTIVHEIAHLFDLNFEVNTLIDNSPKNEERWKDINVTRELLGEGTAIAFEGMFSKYLLKEGMFSKDLIQEISNRRMGSSLQSAKLVYAKLLLEKEKSKTGKITREFIENVMRDKNLSVQFIRRTARAIINEPFSMIFQKRYALGSLVAPTIIKRYEEQGPEAIKKYLESARKGDFNGALEILGIDLSKEGINKLTDNMKEINYYINKDER